MRRRDLLLSSGAAAMGLAAFPFRRVLAQEQRSPAQVLMFTKSAGFEHSVIRRGGEGLSHAEGILTRLARQYGIEVTCTKDGSIFDSDLSRFDGFVFYTTGDLTTPGNDKTPPMSAAGKKRLLDAVADGKGLVGSHCASDTFHSKGPAFENQESPDPYIALLGGEFISHGRQQTSKQLCVSPDFPGAPVPEEFFELHEEWYALKNFPDDLHVILVQETEGMEGAMYQRPRFPATWARRQGQGRVFFTSMGHREDVWTNPIFQRMLMGGLAWSMGYLEADVTPNIDKVTPEARVLKV